MKQDYIRIKHVDYLLWQFESAEEREEYVNYNDYEVSYKCKGENIIADLNLTEDEYIAFIQSLRNSDLDSIYCKTKPFNPELTLIFEI